MAARNLCFVAVMKILLLCGADKAKYCEDKLTNVQGSIRYPSEQGHRYQNNRRCSWTIDLGMDYKIHLSFTEFDLEDTKKCEHDYLQITYGSGKKKYNKKYCGSTLPDDIETDTGHVHLVFHSGWKHSGKGFKLDYRGIKDSPTKAPSFSTFKSKETTQGMTINVEESTTIHRYQESTSPTPTITEDDLTTGKSIDTSPTITQDANTDIRQQGNQICKIGLGIIIAICIGIVVLLILLVLVIVFFRKSRKNMREQHVEMKQQHYIDVECHQGQYTNNTTTKTKSTNTMAKVCSLTKGDETQAKSIYEFAEAVDEMSSKRTESNSLSDAKIDETSIRLQLARGKLHFITSPNDDLYDHASAPPNGEDEYHKLDIKGPKQQHNVDDLYDHAGDLNAVDNYSVLRTDNK